MRGMVRPGASVDALEAAGVEIVRGQLTDPGDVARAVRGVATVYHIAAAYRIAGKPAAYFYAVNAGGTRNVVDACRAAGVERLVHCSTVGVHGSVLEVPCREDSPFNTGDDYQRSKLEGEREVSEAITRGLPAVIVRPAGIYGPGDTRFLKLYRAVASGAFRMIGSGDTLLHLVYIDDLVDGIVRAGTVPRAVGRTYILAGPDYVTLDELVDMVADALGVKRRRMHVPLAPVLIAAVACEMVCKPFRLEPPLHRRRVHFFTKHRAFDIGRARAELGYSPAVSTRDGIERTVRHHLAVGDLDPRRRASRARAWAR